MLIRSQDKRQLISFQNGHISVDFQNPKRVLFCGLSFSDEYDYTCIGEYSTEAKAIKVLDMISSAYDALNTYRNQPEQGWIYSIFQMPKDEEV